MVILEGGRDLDGGLHIGPKHVVLYYVLLLIVINIVEFMTVCTCRYIHTTALYCVL